MCGEIFRLTKFPRPHRLRPNSPGVRSRLETNHLDGSLFCVGPNGLVDWILMICWPFLHFNIYTSVSIFCSFTGLLASFG